MEVELKLALARPEELDALLAELPTPEAVVDQHNHYFGDPEGRLAEAKVMVRVRREERVDAPGGATSPQAIVLTLKRRHSKEGGVFASEERECEVPSELWEAVQAGRTDLLSLQAEETAWLREACGVRELREHAVMINRRRRVHLSGFVLEVDETRFPDGTVEAEVEVETDDAEGARELVLEVARRAGVELHEQTEGKYGRLMKRVRGARG